MLPTKTYSHVLAGLDDALALIPGPKEDSCDYQLFIRLTKFRTHVHRLHARAERAERRRGKVRSKTCS